VDTSFEEFVAARRPELLRTALLLTGDRAGAEELVQRSLTRTRRRWARTADPLATARAALVSGRPVRAEQVIETLPDPSAAGPDPLARALRDLPPRTRAATVLSALDGLTPTQLSPLLGCSPETAAQEADRGTAALQSALAPDLYARPQPGADDPGRRLRDQLTRLATAPGPWQLDAGEAATDVRHRRRRSRWQVAAAAALAVLCVGGAGVQLTRSPAEPAAPPSAPAPTPSGRPAPAAPLGGNPAIPVLTGPTRGSLAGDAPFLDAVRSVGWGGQAPPPVADREVVFAGDTPGGRVVLVVGETEGDFRGTWLTGPAGASAAELAPRYDRTLGRTRPATLLLGGPGDATLVVVAGRADAIELSDRLMVGPRGTVGRDYRPVEATEGAAVVPVRTTQAGPALSVRVLRDGQVVHRSGVEDPRPRSVPPLELAALRPTAEPPDPAVLGAAVTQLAAPLGVEAAEAEPELLWSGPLPSNRRRGSVAVVVAHSPGGALVVGTVAGRPGAVQSCGTSTPPGATDVATLTVVRACDVVQPGLGGSEDARWLVVTAPADAASAELLDDAGQVLGPLPLTDGGAVVPLPAGVAGVRTLDAAGQPLRDTALPPQPTEPFGDYGSGVQR
jgi:DNA-directed RNA polymerase specialized sigma24 family protein